MLQTINTENTSDYRVPNYLSFSAISQFESDRDEYFVRYIATNRPPRSPQGEPASVGSAFDARVKSELYTHVYGPGYMPEKYSYDALFTKQVDEVRRDFAGPAGDHVFECYKRAGFYDRVVEICDRAIEPPQFEFRLEQDILGVPLIGLPDGLMKLPDATVILDWKVNGYCSKPGRSVSPNKGYTLCADGYEAPKPSRSHMKTHKDAEPVEKFGLQVSSQFTEDYQEKWAAQLSGYAWCLGEDVGSEDFLVMMHQCVGKGMPVGRPLLRFAEFMAPVRRPFQEMLIKKYQRVWKAVTTGHIYDEMSREDSDTNCARMEARCNALANDKSEHADFFNNITRPDWRG